MNYRVVHNTTYEYGTPAEACHNVLRLSPRTMPEQTCHGMELAIVPAPAKLHRRHDFFGNEVQTFAIFTPHEKLSITAVSRVTVARTPVALDVSPAWTSVIRGLRHDRHDKTIEALQYVFDSPYVRVSASLREFAVPSFSGGRPLLEAVMHLTKRIRDEFIYDPAATTIDTSVEEVLKKRRGVCQDFAHLQIGCLRSLGLAARYVSGYLRTYAPAGKPRLEGADASHAWISVFCPDLGWVDFDPTNGCVVADDHITLGWGRDYHDVSPVKGMVLGAAGSALSISVEVVAT